MAPSPVFISHSFYKSSSEQETENVSTPTRFPNFTHTFHGRGDSISVNNLPGTRVIMQGEFMLNLMALLSQLAMTDQHISVEINAIKSIGQTISDALLNHPSVCPTWTLHAALIRHLTRRPWMAYRLDAAVDLVLNPTDYCRRCKNAKGGYSAECADHSEQGRFRDEVRNIFSDTATPNPSQHRSLQTSNTARFALVFKALFGMRHVAALSYSRPPFCRNPSQPRNFHPGLANWLEHEWGFDWSSVGVDLPDGQSSPFIWLDVFGMSGEGQFEQKEWSKFSLFTYSMLPVVAHVPVVRDWESVERKQSEMGRVLDANERPFDRLDQDMWKLAQHVNGCNYCTDQMIEEQRRVVRRFGESDSLEDEIAHGVGKVETVRLLDHMRTWPVIERNQALNMGRLILHARAWRAVMRTYALGAMAARMVVDGTMCPEYGQSMLGMIERFGLTPFLAIMNHLSNETRMSIPAVHRSESRYGLPRNRKVKQVDLGNFVKNVDHVAMLHFVQPILTGQVPTVQKVSETHSFFDRRFIMLFAESEPNLLDAAFISSYPDGYVSPIFQNIGDEPDRFFPTEYIRKWLDDRQTTSFSNRFTRRLWYASRMAPGHAAKPGNAYLSSRVCPALAKSLLGMVPQGDGDGDFDLRRVEHCPLVALDISSVYSVPSSGSCEKEVSLDGETFVAVLMRSYSYRHDGNPTCDDMFCNRKPCTCERVMHDRKHYAVDIALCKKVASTTSSEEAASLTPVFSVTFCGRKKTGSNTVVEWKLHGNEEAIMTYEVAEGVNALPILISAGVIVSMHYRTKTETEFESEPFDHLPVKIIAQPGWCDKWKQTDLRFETRDGSARVDLQMD